SSDKQPARIDDDVIWPPGWVDDEAVEAAELVTASASDLRVAVFRRRRQIVHVDVPQPGPGMPLLSCSLARPLVDAGFRDIGELLVCGALLVEGLLQQLGRVVVAELTRPRPRASVTRDFVVLHVLGGGNRRSIPHLAGLILADLFR